MFELLIRYPGRWINESSLPYSSIIQQAAAVIFVPGTGMSHLETFCVLSCARLRYTRLRGTRVLGAVPVKKLHKYDLPRAALVAAGAGEQGKEALPGGGLTTARCLCFLADDGQSKYTIAETDPSPASVHAGCLSP